MSDPCPFCNDAVPTDEERAECPTCQAVYHPECWDCTGGCTACPQPDGEDRPSDEPVDPVARPLPGFETHDAILGGHSELTPTSTVAPSAGMVVDEDRGEVVLTVEGRRSSTLLLVLILVGSPILFVPFLVAIYGKELADSMPWATLSGAGQVGMLIPAAACVLVLLFAIQSFYERARISFTEKGVFRERVMSADFVSWEEVHAYRLVGRGHVLLECDRGQVGVPTPDEATRGQVVELLDRRSVPRAD